MSDVVQKNWGRILSPCILAVAFLFSGIIIDSFRQTGGFSLLGVIIGLPFSLFFLVVDVLAKTLIKNSAIVLWLIEIVAIATGIIMFNYYTS